MAEAADLFERLVLERTPLWTAQLHEDQTYLGRCVIRLNRVAETDFLDLSEEELLAYRSLGRRCKQALTDLFAPDMFNHASLRNEWRQQHVHLIPRYQSRRQFAGVTFEDKRWGRNWPPYEEMPLSEAKLMEIHAALKARLAAIP